MHNKNLNFISAKQLAAKHQIQTLKDRITERKAEPGDDDWSTDDNIRVICRFRPCNKRELSYSKTEKIPDTPPLFKSVQMVQLNRIQKASHMKSQRPYECVLDRILTPKDNQKDMFYFVGQPMITACLEGFNSTVFAYGQSGSGKTYTMFGPEQQTLTMASLGLVPRCIIYLFQKLEERLSLNGGDLQDYRVNIEVLQIYKSDILDLLNTNDKKKRVPLIIKTNFNTNMIYVSGLRSIPIHDTREALAVLTEAQSNRIVAGHALNAVSSRSHMLVMIGVMQRKVDGSIKTSKLNFGDLAGSEDIRKALGSNPDPERMQEAIAINSSLSALTTAISYLSKGKKPSYRDSPLTHVLKDSLGGNSKTVMLVNTSPHIYNRNESIRTLRFAATAKRVKNKAKVNEEQSLQALKNRIKELEIENANLKAQLLESKTKSNQKTKVLTKLLTPRGDSRVTSVRTAGQSLQRPIIGSRSTSIEYFAKRNKNTKKRLSLLDICLPLNEGRGMLRVTGKEGAALLTSPQIDEERDTNGNSNTNNTNGDDDEEDGDGDGDSEADSDEDDGNIDAHIRPELFKNLLLPANSSSDGIQQMQSDENEILDKFNINIVRDSLLDLSNIDFTADDEDIEIHEYVIQISELREQLDETSKSNHDLKAQVLAANNELEQCSNQISKLNFNVNQLTSEMQQLKNKNESLEHELAQYKATYSHLDIMPMSAANSKMYGVGSIEGAFSDDGYLVPLPSMSQNSSVSGGDDMMSLQNHHRKNSTFAFSKHSDVLNEYFSNMQGNMNQLMDDMIRTQEMQRRTQLMIQKSTKVLISSEDDFTEEQMNNDDDETSSVIYYNDNEEEDNDDEEVGAAGAAGAVGAAGDNYFVSKHYNANLPESTTSNVDGGQEIQVQLLLPEQQRRSPNYSERGSNFNATPTVTANANANADNDSKQLETELSEVQQRQSQLSKDLQQQSRNTNARMRQRRIRQDSEDSSCGIFSFYCCAPSTQDLSDGEFEDEEENSILTTAQILEQYLKTEVRREFLTQKIQDNKQQRRRKYGAQQRAKKKRNSNIQGKKKKPYAGKSPMLNT